MCFYRQKTLSISCLAWLIYPNSMMHIKALLCKFTVHVHAHIVLGVNFTTVIKLSSEVAATDNLAIKFLHGFLSAAWVLKAHRGCSEERFGLRMAVKLDTVDRTDLITHFLQEGALDALVETNDKDIPFWRISLPKLVKLVWNMCINEIRDTQKCSWSPQYVQKLYIMLSAL